MKLVRRVRKAFTDSVLYGLVKRADFLYLNLTSGRSAGDGAVPRAESATPKPTRYLSVFTRFRNEAKYLPEFISFHLAVGAEHFYLYNNNSTDNYLEVLQPFIDGGVVTLVDWPAKPASPTADVHCVLSCRGVTRWLACIDIDEFLLPVVAESLPKVLAEYEAYPALTASWNYFGSSGHNESPKGLVIENYLKCEGKINRHIKSIINPSRAIAYGNPHYWVFRGWTQAVDENRRPVIGSFSRQPSAAKIRINHYYVKSREDFMARRAPDWTADKLSHRHREDVEESLAKFCDSTDPAILRFADATRAEAAKFGVQL